MKENQLKDISLQNVEIDFNTYLISNKEQIDKNVYIPQRKTKNNLNKQLYTNKEITGNQTGTVSNIRSQDKKYSPLVYCSYPEEKFSAQLNVLLHNSKLRLGEEIKNLLNNISLQKLLVISVNKKYLRGLI